MAANLSLVMDDTDKVRELLRRRARAGTRDPAARRQRVELPLRAGRREAHPLRPRRQSRAPAQQAIDAIVAARAAGGPFRDLFDFCRRVDKRLVNRRAVEALIRAGAFDAIDARRAALFASVGIALGEAERAEATRAQVSLFGEEQQRRGARAGRGARMDRGRAAVARKGGARLLPVGPPVCGLRGGARADRAHAARRACSRAASAR